MKKICLFFFTLRCLGTIAQTASSFDKPKLIPPSPEVASIAKFTEIPMSFSTGTPVINIPLYTLKDKNIEVPVSLSYNASGIKVEEAATWVGLGWNLSTGGSLTRNIRGIADDHSSNGYMFTIHTIANLKTLFDDWDQHSDPNSSLIEINGISGPTAAENINDNNIDAQADVFSYSVMGYSGKFCWNQNTSSFIQYPLTNARISYSLTPSNGIKSFTITLPNGVKAYFGVSKDLLRQSVEANGVMTVTNYSENNTSSNTSQSTTGTSPYATNWSLMTIESPSGETIEFNYTSIAAMNFGRMSENSIPFDWGGGTFHQVEKNISASFFQQLQVKPILTSIQSNNGKIVFELQTNIRDDVFQNERALNAVKVFDNNNSLVKYFQFDYDYTTSTGQTDLFGLSAFAQVARKRLRLLSLQELDASGNLMQKPYTFTYSNIELPDRLSSGQDYWGYYNGKRNNYNDFLIPKVDYKCSGVNITGNIGLKMNETTGADRVVDANLCQAGVLKKLTYPTGGFTEYEYESNEAPLFQDNIQGCIERSGLENKHFDFGVSNNALPTHYYEQNFTIGSGVYGFVFINVVLPVCTNPSSCGVLFEIKGVGNPFYTTLPSLGKQHLSLPMGNYKVTATISNSVLEIPNYNVSFDWKEQGNSNNFIVGGLRVKRIRSYDNLGNYISRSYDYNLFGNQQTSSGFLKGFPAFSRLYPNSNQVELYSTSVTPLFNDGGIILYTNVTEFYDDAKVSHKTEYTFNLDLGDYTNDYRNLTITKSWRDGYLANKKTYEKISNGSYRSLTEEQHTYAADGEIAYLYCIEYFKRANLWCKYYNPNSYFRTEWFYPTSSTTTTYSYEGGVTRTSMSTSVNEYDGNHLITRVTTTNSKGDIIATKIWHPDDYDNSVGNVSTLKAKNLIELPIKVETLVNGKTKTGILNFYDNKGQVTDVHKFENNVLTKLTHSNTNYFPSPNLYNPYYYMYYDNYNNLKMINKLGDLSEIYLYGYNHQYPVAKIVGSNYATVANTITQSILDNPADDAALRAELAKLRGIAGALVTTYTYKPLVGVTSETDPQGKTIYYEYDNSNRLKLIRDKDNNILKTFDYQYQQQVN